jgi:hypothetical protein
VLRLYSVLEEEKRACDALMYVAIETRGCYFHGKAICVMRSTHEISEMSM